MREIKFRAWDKSDHDWYKNNPAPKRMTYFHNPVIFDDGYLQFESDGQAPIGDYGEDRFEIMQFTGLKDKNGKEIYEGDIVENKTQIVKEIKDKYIFTGKYKKTRYVATWNEHWAQWDIIEGAERGELEVIGNIYDNPELLNSERE